jgi:hypothetical protein
MHLGMGVLAVGRGTGLELVLEPGTVIRPNALTRVISIFRRTEPFLSRQASQKRML